MATFDDSASVLSDTSTLHSYYHSSDADDSRQNGYRSHHRASSDTKAIASSTMTVDYLNDKSLADTPGHLSRRYGRPGRRNIGRSRSPLSKPRQLAPQQVEVESPLEALADAIGPDNVGHTNELDAIPCAGIRIPYGRFKGLLAWRFVVRLHDKNSINRDPNRIMPAPHSTQSSDTSTQLHRRKSLDLGVSTTWQPVTQARRVYAHERSHSEVNLSPIQPQWHDLPDERTPRPGMNFGNYNYPATARLPSAAAMTSDYIISDAVVANFIFDTSQAHSTISRETLEALGVQNSVVYSLEESETKTISLYLQSLPQPITFHLAPRGQPGRLGVEFLEESQVNIRLGEGGRGGIVWIDETPNTKSLLRNVPRTVALPKQNLQSRVRALFGLDS
ncbi:hypothetical protein FA15DRAFT_669456 [Coprinopsis marcescibilis]|uniref:Uncharacterized protein n=1 Tax=Coprinopsis marcescibilis TaxID=230819 RepID=A0A5C3KXL5_COPMA|nr:hypothetical protein FA15DRAFT_669456 [Coprinopsis marcescibilis]